MKNKKILQFLVFGLLSLVFVVVLGKQVYAQNNIPNINGQWTYHAIPFSYDGNGCDTYDRLGQKESTVTINQRGNEFTSNGGIVIAVTPSPPWPVQTAIGEGTITNTQIQSRIPDSGTTRIFSWTGTINPDGNTINGTATCANRGVYRGNPFSLEENTRFTLTRSSQPSQNQTNSPPPVTPPPSQNPRGGLRPL